MPALVWRTSPARSIRRCETICASAGFSLRVGRKYWLIRMARNVGSEDCHGKPGLSPAVSGAGFAQANAHTLGALPGENKDMLDAIFKLSENKTTVRTEIVAGITTFL